jgi:hypothetical protein
MAAIKTIIGWLAKNWPYVLVVIALVLIYSNLMKEKETNQKALNAALATNKAIMEAQSNEIKKVEALIQKAGEEKEKRDKEIQKETEYHREVIVREVQARVKASNEKAPDDLARDFAKSFGAEYVKVNED